MNRTPSYRPPAWPDAPKGHAAVTRLIRRAHNPDVHAAKATNLQAVRVNSRAECQGRTQQHDDPTPSPELPAPPSRRPGILVVDDDVGVRALLNDALWQQGFIVWLAGNGLQALELYQELSAEIDLVLLDIQMPHLDGPHTLTALQRLHPGVCCCFMTADCGYYCEKDLLERGAAHIFRKPFRLLEMAQALWDMVNDSAGPRNQSTSGDTLPELFLG
jgi:two-component system response regulator (stage 0 sporulation protein F)